MGGFPDKVNAMRHFGAHLVLWMIWLSPAGAEVDFGTEILPVLSQNCFQCHGPDASARKGGLRLDTAEGALAGGDNGPAIVPGSLKDSAVWSRIHSNDPDEHMPPTDSGKSLKTIEKERITTWIEEGAHYEKHWSLIPPQQSPSSVASQRSRSVLDTWVEDRLRSESLRPSPDADPARLLRRLYLDLTGLPPSVGERLRFLRDSRPEVFEREVDRQLASPAFGEKWARMWLDLARYADSNGFQRDGFRTLWPFRDWVIDAYNRDLPYDTFVHHQLGGDLLPEPTVDSRVATGFHRCTTLNLEAGTNRESERLKQVVDRVNVTGTVFLGLTLECAQCHEHKYDPISQEDYYRIFAYFNNTPIESKFRTKKDTASIDFTEAPSQALDPDENANRQLAQLKNELAKLKAQKKGEDKKATTTKRNKRITEIQWHIDRLEPRALVMQELPAPRETRVFLRGEFESPGPVVAPDTPAFLGRTKTRPRNRLEFARWLTGPADTLSARVAVNRWWAEIFGTGLVSTPENFGVQGEPPSHPRVLDHLALRLKESGWSRKLVLREVLLSSTYRQSSRQLPNDPALEVDADNRLLWRGPRFRLSAEGIRDQALALSGLLAHTSGGAPVFPPQPPGVWRVTGQVDNTYRESKGADRFRRGVYTVWRRSAHYPSFAAFDAPNRGACTVTRPRTNTPMQALTLLNDPAYEELTVALARRLCEACPGKPVHHQLGEAFRYCMVREPQDWELKRLEEHFRSLLPDKDAAWRSVAAIFLNLDEMITKS